MIAWLTARERWQPALAGFAWWAIFHPGFISEDSISQLLDIRSGSYSVWFTAWWVYVVNALTLGARVIPLMTLVSVVTLEYAVYFWIRTVFPRTPARAVTVALIAFSPLVGAMGIQIRHDVALATGLLIAAAVVTRTWSAPTLTVREYSLLLLAMPLVATRHNGVPTLIAAAVLMVILSRKWWRHAAVLVVVAGGASVITYAATRASSNATAVDPLQTVEWLMADISCALARGVEPTGDEWATLAKIAARDAWPQPRACVVMNPMLVGGAVNPTAAVTNYRDLIGVWRSLAMRHPGQMIAAHASRVRLFLPPRPPLEVPSFLHSTVVPNDFGIRWTFPSLAERVRVVVRGWNAGGFILANSMVWLIALLIAAWRMPSWRDRLTPTIVIGSALNLGLIVAAPVSEGRYGLFILVSGQATVLYALLSRVITELEPRALAPE